MNKIILNCALKWLMAACMQLVCMEDEAYISSIYVIVI
jgi:hypothetical protein